MSIFWLFLFFLVAERIEERFGVKINLIFLTLDIETSRDHLNRLEKPWNHVYSIKCSNFNLKTKTCPIIMMALILTIWFHFLCLPSKRSDYISVFNLYKSTYMHAFHLLRLFFHRAAIHLLSILRVWYQYRASKTSNLLLKQVSQQNPSA